MRCLCLLPLLLIAAAAAIVDRIDVVVGEETITELQLEEEITVTAFLNREPVSQDSGSRRSAAHRLVQQTLIAREMQLARFPAPGREDLADAIRRVREEYQNEAAYTRALADYGLREDVIRQHLKTQIETLRFIEYRFRPELTVSDQELHDEYSRRSDNWKVGHPDRLFPAFDASRETLRNSLVEARTDAALDTWLSEAELQVRIVFVETDLAPVPAKPAKVRP